MDPAAEATVAAADTSSGSAVRVIDDPDGPGVAVTAEAAAASDPNEIVCRREKATGSNIARRICRTRAEIDARTEKDQDTLRRSRETQSGGQCVLEGTC